MEKQFGMKNKIRKIESDLPIRRDPLLQRRHNLRRLVRPASLEIVPLALCGFVHHQLFLAPATHVSIKALSVSSPDRGGPLLGSDFHRQNHMSFGIFSEETA